MMRSTPLDMDSALATFDTPEFAVLPFDVREELALYLVHGYQPRLALRRMLCGHQCDGSIKDGEVILGWIYQRVPACARGSMRSMMRWRGRNTKRGL